MPIIEVLPVSNRNIKTLSQEVTVPADITGKIRVFFPMPVQDKRDPTNHLTLELDVFDDTLTPPDFRHSVSYTWVGGIYTDRFGNPDPDPAIRVSGVDYAGKRVRMLLDDFSKGMRVGCSVEY